MRLLLLSHPASLSSGSSLARFSALAAIAACAMLPGYAQDASCTGSVSSSACGPTTQEVHQEVPAYPMRVYRMGVDVHVGSAGIGSEFAAPVAHKFDVRAGTDFFSYSTIVANSGNQLNVGVRLRSARAALDWYPTHHAFRVSPLLVFANSTHLGVAVNLGAGQSVTLNNATYYSSPVDPLHGSATVDLRRVSPGLSVGFGRLIPRREHHFSFPFEAGFYYAGSPVYKVQFSGTACDAQFPGPAGCEQVQNDPSFQQNLAAFKAKYQTYVNYASFFPIVSSGVAFAF